MKNRELRQKLLEYDDETEVAIFDWRKNLNCDYGEGSGEGLYIDYDIDIVEEEERRSNDPFIVLSFDNEEYNNTGEYLSNH